MQLKLTNRTMKVANHHPMNIVIPNLILILTTKIVLPYSLVLKQQILFALNLMT